MTQPATDASLAIERTTLSWQRFSLQVAVVGLLCMRAALVGHHPLLGFLLAFVLAAFAASLQIAGPKLPVRLGVRLALAATLTAAAGSLLLAFL